jgi:hypothetical protein
LLRCFDLRPPQVVGCCDGDRKLDAFFFIYLTSFFAIGGAMDRRTWRALVPGWLDGLRFVRDVDDPSYCNYALPISPFSAYPSHTPENGVQSLPTIFTPPTKEDDVHSSPYQPHPKHVKLQHQCTAVLASVLIQVFDSIRIFLMGFVQQTPHHHEPEENHPSQGPVVCVLKVHP